MDPTMLNAGSAIEMAEIGPATAVGVEHLVGSLEVGKPADIAVFNLGTAHSTVANRQIAALVFSAHRSDVDEVLVDGTIRVHGGELVGFEAEKSVLNEATERATAAIERAGLTSRVFQHWRPQAWQCVGAANLRRLGGSVTTQSPGGPDIHR